MLADDHAVTRMLGMQAAAGGTELHRCDCDEEQQTGFESTLHAQTSDERLADDRPGNDGSGGEL